ncbi:MAG: amidohydrolase [Tabrizicola sp.]|nr:amidohydrolase [Tabrizicola sp.]
MALPTRHLVAAALAALLAGCVPGSGGPGKGPAVSPLATSEIEVTALRRAIHQEPELGLENTATRAKLLAQLDGLPLELTAHRKSSGLVARLRGAKPGRRILLRADTDALPMPEDNALAFRSQRAGAMHVTQ